MKGEISGNEDLCIDGTNFAVAPTVHFCSLAADVIAGEVIVYGAVKDNVHGKGKIEIKKDGSVNGDLTTARIIIEDGAYFKGSIAIENRVRADRWDDRPR